MRRFLRALQGGELPSDLHSELRQRIGEPAFEALIAEGVLVRGDRATTYPCPGGGSECPRDVVENPGDPDFPFVAVPPGPELCCPSVRLTEADLETKRTSRPDLIKLISRLFDIEGPANTTTEVFRHAHRLGRSRWGGVEREVLLCTNLNGSEAVGHLAARQAMRQPTLVLAHARTRYTSHEAESRFRRGGVVEVLFLEDCLAIEEGRVILREPVATGVAEPMATYDIAQEPFCVLIDKDGRREIDEATYRDLTSRMTSYDLFIDLLSTVSAGRYRSGHTDEEGVFVETSLTQQQAWGRAGREAPAHASRRARRPERLRRYKQVESARRAVDLKLGHSKWRSTELITHGDRASKEFLFKPPDGLRFAVLRPMS